MFSQPTSNYLRKFMKVTLLHMLPVAIALHGGILMIPTPSGEVAAEKPKVESSPVSVTQLPKQPIVKMAITPTPMPSVKPPIPSPRFSASAPQSSAPTPEASPQPTQSASPLPSPSPSVSPSPSPSVSPSPTDEIQIEGAQKGCNGLLGCWQVSETKGRMVTETLERKLKDQGFVLTPQDLDDDTGMSVYAVTKQDGTFQYYLHVIWSDRGTVYVKKPELISTIDELRAIAGI
jgi:hypothetical protein